MSVCTRIAFSASLPLYTREVACFLRYPFYGSSTKLCPQTNASQCSSSQCHADCCFHLPASLGESSLLKLLLPMYIFPTYVLLYCNGAGTAFDPKLNDAVQASKTPTFPKSRSQFLHVSPHQHLTLVIGVVFTRMMKTCIHISMDILRRTLDFAGLPNSCCRSAP